MAEAGKGEKFTVYFTNKKEDIQEHVVGVRINQSDDKTFYAYAFDSKTENIKTEGKAKTDVEVSNDNMPCIIFSMSGAENVLKSLEFYTTDKDFQYKVFYQFNAYIISSTNYMRHIRAVFEAIEKNTLNNSSFALQEISVAASMKDVSIIASSDSEQLWNPKDLNGVIAKPEIKDDVDNVLLFTCQLKSNAKLDPKLQKIPFFMFQKCLVNYRFDNAALYTIPKKIITRELLLGALSRLGINSKDKTKAYIFNAFNFNYIVVPYKEDELRNFSAPSIRQIEFDQETSKKDLSECKNLGRNKLLAAIEFTNGNYVAYVQRSSLK